MKKEDVRNSYSGEKKIGLLEFSNTLSLNDQNYMNIRKHLEKVIDEIRAIHFNDKVKVTIEHELDSCLLKIPQVTCCGRIVKEWVTNTIINAFHGQQHQCTIKVTFKEVNHLRFLLRIEDNAIGGATQQLNLNSPERKLVDNLIRLLNGKSTITKDHGATLQVIFDFQSDLVEIPEMGMN